LDPTKSSIICPHKVVGSTPLLSSESECLPHGTKEECPCATCEHTIDLGEHPAGWAFPGFRFTSPQLSFCTFVCQHRNFRKTCVQKCFHKWRVWCAAVQPKRSKAAATRTLWSMSERTASLTLSRCGPLTMVGPRLEFFCGLLASNSFVDIFCNSLWPFSLEFFCRYIL
jgi:hypothetical protein